MKLWIPLVTGLATYLLLTMLFGEYGVFNYRELRSYRSRLEAHVAMLQARKERLEREELLLRENGERIRIEAHSLGYVRPEERLLRIDGSETGEQRTWVAGSIIRPAAPLPDHSGSIRAISICAALLSLILVLTRSPAEKKSRRRRIREEQDRKEEEQAYSIRRASM
jgi:cell division protein FtsB